MKCRRNVKRAACMVTVLKFKGLCNSTGRHFSVTSTKWSMFTELETIKMARYWSKLIWILCFHASQGVNREAVAPESLRCPIQRQCTKPVCLKWHKYCDVVLWGVELGYVISANVTSTLMCYRNHHWKAYHQRFQSKNFLIHLRRYQILLSEAQAVTCRSPLANSAPNSSTAPYLQTERPLWLVQTVTNLNAIDFFIFVNHTPLFTIYRRQGFNFIHLERARCKNEWRSKEKKTTQPRMPAMILSLAPLVHIYKHVILWFSIRPGGSLARSPAALTAPQCPSLAAGPPRGRPPPSGPQGGGRGGKGGRLHRAGSPSRPFWWCGAAPWLLARGTEGDGGVPGSQGPGEAGVARPTQPHPVWGLPRGRRSLRAARESHQLELLRGHRQTK